MKRLFPVLAALLVFAASGCAPKVDVEAEQATIREMIMEWNNAANAKDVERMVALFSDDASILPPNTPILTGKEGIRKVWSELVERPGLSESTQVTKVGYPAQATWATRSVLTKARGTTRKGTRSPSAASGYQSIRNSLTGLGNACSTSGTQTFRQRALLRSSSRISGTQIYLCREA